MSCISPAVSLGEKERKKIKKKKKEQCQMTNVSNHLTSTATSMEGVPSRMLKPALRLASSLK